MLKRNPEIVYKYLKESFEVPEQSAYFSSFVVYQMLKAIRIHSDNTNQKRRYADFAYKIATRFENELK